MSATAETVRNYVFVSRLYGLHQGGRYGNTNTTEGTHQRGAA